MSRRVSNDYGYCLELDQKLNDKMDTSKKPTNLLTLYNATTHHILDKELTRKTKIGART